MSETNQELRDISIPFKGIAFSDEEIAGGNGSTDLGLLEKATSPQQNHTIRISTPEKIRLVESYLNLTIRVTQASLGFKIGIGQFVSGEYVADTIDTDKLDSDHLQLTGSNNYITATAGNDILIDGLNLLPLIPKLGDADFLSDGFVLIVSFDKVPDSAGYAVTKFEVNCSSLLGVL